MLIEKVRGEELLIKGRKGKASETRLKALFQLGKGERPFGMIVNEYNRGRKELRVTTRGNLQTNGNSLKQESKWV